MGFRETAAAAHGLPVPPTRVHQEGRHIKAKLPESFVRLSGAAQEVTDTLGPLSSLAGTWVGNKGWNIVALPAAGSKPEETGDFILLIQPYMETITFAPLGGLVRNRGGDLDQFVSGLGYDLRVSDTDTDEALHVENGMWLNLGDIKKNESGCDGPAPPFPIVRSATIPHGDSALILGHAETQAGPPSIPDISSLPPDVGQAPLGYTDPYTVPHDGVNVANPNATLREAIADQNIVSTTTLVVDSKNQGGITNIPFIVQRANTTRFQCVFWIETVEDADSGQTFEQLQYTQIIDIVFHHKFGDAKKGLITWPHVNINTLKKQ